MKKYLGGGGNNHLAAKLFAGDPQHSSSPNQNLHKVHSKSRYWQHDYALRHRSSITYRQKEAYYIHEKETNFLKYELAVNKRKHKSCRTYKLMRRQWSGHFYCHSSWTLLLQLKYSYLDTEKGYWVLKKLRFFYHYHQIWHVSAISPRIE